MLRISFSDGIYRSHAPAFQSHGASSEPQSVSVAAEPRFPSSDRVQISSASSFKALLSQAAKKCAGEIQDSVSSQRLQDLRQQFSAGTYPINAEDVAGRMLDRITVSGMGFDNE